ncbi:MAG: hypothetical protein A3G34_07265 [Candidatus Lindowbacteria bacterium RIFCSPLOWO2_12_FULL_62_27]|nr:MAG: hypothetical protein A3I06_04520 [Candidatus Lindowbacteria bacterium RIFCSPLOWO2_02_FULL_62_12]OGH59612.1 MAG: hypothetical protein A3G34_07265 [Candidatus Lindowbacteria bacterium RIFCSPLOWO2_12_FULL_62_27]
MANLNKVLLIGNLTRQPELRYTPGGSAVTTLGVAVNRRFKDSSGALKEEVTFVDVSVFSKQAEACSQYLQKGSPVFVEGRLHLRKWETPDGQARTKLDVTAERVQFLSRRGDAPSRVAEPVPAGESAEAAPPAPDSDLPPDDDVPF